MTLCRQTANKWACSSKHTVVWCLNRNSTVDGVIITVTFCIITVWVWRIWGRAMATLMNQWANEAGIVLAYWNTLRKIERVVARCVRTPSLLSYHRIEALRRKRSDGDLKAAQIYFVLWQKKKNTNKCGIKSPGCSIHHLAPHKPLSQGLDWGWFWGQRSWRGNFVVATCSATDCP